MGKWKTFILLIGFVLICLTLLILSLIGLSKSINKSSDDSLSKPSDYSIGYSLSNSLSKSLSNSTNNSTSNSLLSSTSSSTSSSVTQSTSSSTSSPLYTPTYSILSMVTESIVYLTSKQRSNNLKAFRYKESDSSSFVPFSQSKVSYEKKEEYGLGSCRGNDHYGNCINCNTYKDENNL